MAEAHAGGRRQDGILFPAGIQVTCMPTYQQENPKDILGLPKRHKARAAYYRMENINRDKHHTVYTCVHGVLSWDPQEA